MRRASPETHARPLTNERSLGDLVSVGVATLRDFELLGIHSIAQLKKADARELYDRLCMVTQTCHDACCQDVFAAAIAQARAADLPAYQRRWWYWSRVRKGATPSRAM